MEYEEIIELLPFYLNDKLKTEQKERVRQAVSESQSLQQELIFLQSINDSIKSENVRSPGDWGLMRLKRDILAEESKSGRIGLAKTEHNKQSWWKSVAIAASFAFVVQSGYLIQQHFIQPEDYRLLSTVELENTVKVQFMAEVSESDVRTMLINLHGNIVKGPSAMGIYHISFEDRQSAIASLKVSGLVKYAEATQE
jgi:hypothetical protein